MLEAQLLTREFLFNGKTLPDPGSEMSPEKVIQYYSGTFPELINANIDKKEIKDEKITFHISHTAGTKG